VRRKVQRPHLVPGRFTQHTQPQNPKRGNMTITGFTDTVRDEIQRHWDAAKKNAFNSGAWTDVIDYFIVRVTLISSESETVELTVDAKGNRDGQDVIESRVKKSLHFSTAKQLVKNIIAEIAELEKPELI
jgi:hypothetical protein